jgi:hypothetical protein
MLNALRQPNILWAMGNVALTNFNERIYYAYVGKTDVSFRNLSSMNLKFSGIRESGWRQSAVNNVMAFLKTALNHENFVQRGLRGFLSKKLKAAMNDVISMKSTRFENLPTNVLQYAGFE